MFLKLLILFTIVPVVELYVLIKAGQNIGTLNTIALIIITGMVGAAFAKSQGAQIILKVRATLSQGQMPGRELLEGALVLTGGILLITPGFLTDLLGLSLIIPLTRKFYANITLKYFKKKFKSGQWHFSGYSNYHHPNEPGDENNHHPEIDD